MSADPRQKHQAQVFRNTLLVPAATRKNLDSIGPKTISWYLCRNLSNPLEGYAALIGAVTVVGWLLLTFTALTSQEPGQFRTHQFSETTANLFAVCPLSAFQITYMEKYP